MLTPDGLATDAQSQGSRGDGGLSRTPLIVRVAIWGVAALAALGAAAAPGEATGITLVDRMWCAGFGAVFTLAASRSRRWACGWSATVALAFSGGWSLALAAVGFLLALVGFFSSTRNRLMGALAGGLVVQALLRFPVVGFFGVPTMIAAIAVIPVLWSAYACAPRTTRRRIRRACVLGVILIGMALVGVAVALAVAYPKMDRSLNDARAGRRLLAESEFEEAGERFISASRGFELAEAALDAPWAMPARVLPIVGQNVDALVTGSRTGRELTTTAAEVATTAPYQDLRASEGEVDLEVVQAMYGPVQDSISTLEDAQALLGGVDSSWLTAPVSDQFEQFSDDVTGALSDARLASKALALAPPLLGGDGTRQYLVLFTSPAESRFLGGFVGAYGVLTAVDGHIAFEESGDISELNDAIDPASRTLPDFPGRDDYEARYGRFFPTRFSQNLTVSPDLETNALVTRAIYEQTSGRSVDGVIVADPYALSGFLQLTGPVFVEGLGREIGYKDVVDYLLVDQYVEFAGANVTRQDRLSEVADATFDALTSRDLPSLRTVGRVLGPRVDAKHLMLWMFDGDDQDLFDDLGANGRFTTGDGDFFSVRTANGGANKIDSFLTRSVDYDVEFDPDTGATTATATVTLTNDAPAAGLPDYIIGNSTGDPPGTSIQYLSFYTPLLLTSATIDGEPAPTTRQPELGATTYSLLLAIPPGEQVTLRLQLRGALPPGTNYQLRALAQPTVNPDEVTILIRSGSDRWDAHATDTLDLDEGEATWDGELIEDHQWELVFDSSG